MFRAVHLSDEADAPRHPAIELERGARVPASELVRVAAECGIVLDPAGLFFSDDPEARRAAAAKTGSEDDDDAAAMRPRPTAFVGCGRFRKVGYVVREATSADVSSLVDVEAANWDETQKQMRTPRAVVEERVANNPACNLAVADAEMKQVDAQLLGEGRPNNFIIDNDFKLNTVFAKVGCYRPPIYAPALVDPIYESEWLVDEFFCVLAHWQL